MEKTFPSLIRLGKISPYIQPCAFHTAKFVTTGRDSRTPDSENPKTMHVDAEKVLIASGEHMKLHRSLRVSAS